MLKGRRSTNLGYTRVLKRKAEAQATQGDVQVMVVVCIDVLRCEVLEDDPLFVPTLAPRSAVGLFHPNFLAFQPSYVCLEAHSAQMAFETDLLVFPTSAMSKRGM